MDAGDWQRRIEAVVRAANNGDPAPLLINCQRIAELEAFKAAADAKLIDTALANAVPVLPIGLKELKKPKTKAEEASSESDSEQRPAAE